MHFYLEKGTLTLFHLIKYSAFIHSLMDDKGIESNQPNYSAVIGQCA